MAEQGRVVDLAGYCPGFLRDIREFRTIAGAGGEELQRLYRKVDGLWEDGFIESSMPRGVRRWESILGIHPYPEDSLTERRAAIQLKWNQQLPYVLMRLRERLEAVVGGDYGLLVRYRECELELVIIGQTYRVLQELREMTRGMIPANLLFIFAGLYPSDIPVDTAVSGCLGLRSDFYARYNRAFLYLDGSWGLDGTYALNGYKELGHLDLYPARLAVVGVCGIPQSTVTGMSITSEIQEDVGQRHIRVWAASEARWDIGAGTSLRSTSVIDARPESDLHLKVEKDLWYLDGTYLLDGEKLLDAQIIDYEL